MQLGPGMRAAQPAKEDYRLTGRSEEDDRTQRDLLLSNVRAQNFALQRLIATTARLIARSRELLRLLQGGTERSGRPKA